ncbi:Hypothetical predicted protein [Xyrichtys novacula]|uniref:Uncharacterized protein n=1 Tax=Xyrichtys novacula TaxID=13765 RepID=A0AAV1HAN5_XYRNO|nr:Hypothetical predicted protein [Xyrichtys novacula]
MDNHLLHRWVVCKQARDDPDCPSTAGVERMMRMLRNPTSPRSRTCWPVGYPGMTEKEEEMGMLCGAYPSLLLSRAPVGVEWSSAVDSCPRLRGEVEVRSTG